METSQTIARNSGLSAALTETYQYNDPANRLSVANESGSGCSQTYGYDAFGNRTVGGCTPSTFTPAAESGYNASSNQLTVQGATYDAAGNQAGIGAYAFVYDAENRMISSTNGSTTNYVYDGEGRRVQKVTGTPDKRSENHTASPTPHHCPVNGSAPIVPTNSAQ